MVWLMLIGRSRNLELRPHYPAIGRCGKPCYLTFGKQAGGIPQDATKESHKSQRELFKQCVLGVQYGMEAESLALRIGQPTIVARDLLRAHHETYPTFWEWSDAAA